MKKLFTLIICLLFIPVVFAKDTVEITKVELETKSDKAVINNEPTFDGLEINCDIGFVEINDFVKYKGSKLSCIFDLNYEKIYKVSLINLIFTAILIFIFVILPIIFITICIIEQIFIK